MIYNQQNVLGIMSSAIGKVKEEFAAVNDHPSSPGKKEILLEIMTILEKMKWNVHDPEKHEEVINTGLGRFITDSWPFDDSLAMVILNAIQVYEKYLKKRAYRKSTHK